MFVNSTGFVFAISDFDIYFKKINIKNNYNWISMHNKNFVTKTKTIRKTPINQKLNDNEEIYPINKELETENLNNESSSNDNLYSFWKEITEEIKMIEWPSVDRLFKQFVIVVISLVLSAFVIYSVDGLFAWGSKILFEGKY
nr:preprotein translocase secE subunit [Cryptomonas curvata]